VSPQNRTDIVDELPYSCYHSTFPLLYHRLKQLLGEQSEAVFRSALFSSLCSAQLCSLHSSLICSSLRALHFSALLLSVMSFG
jgi:hypothetical protein